MDNAKKYGYQFVIIRGYLFVPPPRQRRGGSYFRRGCAESVEKLYQLRQEYQKSHPMNLIAKLLMNSLYGKFGMKPEQTIVELHSIKTEKDRQDFEEFLSVSGLRTPRHGEKLEDFILVGRRSASGSGAARAVPWPRPGAAPGDYYVTIRKTKMALQYNEKEDFTHGLDISALWGAAAIAIASCITASARVEMSQAPPRQK